MIGANLWTAAGIVNGATGVVKDIMWPPYCTDHRRNIPRVVMVKFDHVNLQTPFGSSTDEADANWIPVPSSIVKWGDGIDIASRRQFPIKLSYAITIHMSQGLTVDKANLYIEGTKERQSGLTYTALTRVRRADDIQMMKTVTLKRLENLRMPAVAKRLEEDRVRYNATP